ncbi:MAG TPA: DUF3127 domain-containing protein [Flavitalea sp.]|nr:DUF3127 domain-containing protein [Flavitalea sp.]
MEITGKLLQLLPQQTGQGKNGTWKKQEFIIETGDTYPKKVCLAIWGDKIDIGKVSIGTTVTVSFDAESREFNSRWYTDLKAYALKTGAAEKKIEKRDVVEGEETDDLPF